MIARKRGLAFLAIVALAFGIGLTTAMFSIVNGALLRGLPFPESHRIFSLGLRDVQRQTDSSISPDVFRTIADRQQSFEAVAAFSLLASNVVGPGNTAERYAGAQISTNMLELLRTAPARGRDFRPADGEPGAPPVVIIGHKIWVDVFGGVTDVIGSTLRVNGATTTVIGVMPPSFRFPLSQDLWTPLTIGPEASKATAGPSLQIVGRLRADTSLTQAQAEMSTFAKQLALERPDRFASHTVVAKPYVEAFLSGGTAEMIYTMLAAALGVLLIACVNVANLMLARGADRTREMAVRASVGASRGRVLRQLMIEVLVLTTVGAGFAVILAQLGIALFNAAIADSLPPFWIDIRIDPVVLSFVTVVTVTAAILAGIVPAVRVSRVDLTTAMSEDSRTASAHIGVFSRGLVIVEVALSCGLAVASGLIIQGIARASSADFDFAMSDVWYGRLILPVPGYASEDKRRRALDDIVTGLQAIHGAVNAAVATDLPTGTLTASREAHRA
jgi:putative ABC transport system permease protein